MAEKAVRSTDAAPGTPTWRTVDIVVTAVLGVAFGVLFWLWSLLYTAAGPAFAGFPPSQAVMYGVWLVAAVVAPLIVRKPGAAVFAELIGATVEALLGSHFGSTVILYGLLQGLAAELGFAAFRYRRFGWLQALLAAALAGLAAALLDFHFYYPDWTGGWKTVYLALVVTSTVLVAGIGGTALTRALRASGALSSFAADRTRV
ncbi:ECF transporter S component [Modestobacter muralis]|uniref:ECF transporter S component n=1 Tax=Modestobacter muralis TaxID=1608614 RepID=A0A6P0H4A0_9ACTN|nr:ECF transporter S component [Modestobacter muralis]NEK93873.1 ECF transporter S component [Modestobacter muralis]NEN50640.1 ECF transporter S component [Modestobacter muralis]